MRKYDYSFLNPRWRQLVGYIEEVSSLKDNFEKVANEKFQKDINRYVKGKINVILKV